MSQHIIIIVISVLSFSLGCFIYVKPMTMFAIQKRFYEAINWRIEPISLKKEIRNTKAMGLFLMIFVIGVWAYLLRAGWR